MNPPCRRCGHLALCSTCLADPSHEFATADPVRAVDVNTSEEAR